MLPSNYFFLWANIITEDTIHETPRMASFRDILGNLAQAFFWLVALFLLAYIIPAYIYIIEHPIYLIPVGVGILVVTGGIYYYKEQRKKIRMTAMTLLSEVMKLNWREFEEFVADMLKQKWFHTILWVGVKDGWIDVTATLGDKKFYVQCKHYQTDSIGVEKIRELNGVMKGEIIPVGWIFVTTTGFTLDAISEARKYGIELWDRNYLTQYLESENVSVQNIEHGKCELCGGTLVFRTTHTWVHSWQQFLWCETFPKCRFMKTI